jgi:hypothetical protein
VNSDGLVELVPYNLVQYSEQFDNASWGKGATSVTANTAISPSGIMDADTYTANGSSNVKQIFTTLLPSASTNYTLSIYAKKDTNDFIQFLSSSGTFGGSFYANFDLQNGVIGQYTGTLSAPKITDVGDGWYRCEASVVSVASPTVGAAMSISLITSATSPRAETNSLSTSVFLWGAQLVEGTNALPYQKTETRLNIPRLDYSLGGCPNILLEPQRTNNLSYSQDFANVYWAKSDITFGADGVSPSGLTDADLIVTGTANSDQITTTITLAATNTITQSVFIKKVAGADWVDFIALRLGFGNSVKVWFNISTGAVGSSLQVGTTSLNSASIEDYGNGWLRLIVTTTDSTNNTNFDTRIRTATANSSDTRVNNSSYYLWGAQLEAGSYATSYIPTTTASVTRNNDVMSNDNFVVANNGNFAVSGEFFLLEDKNELYGRNGAIILRLFLTGKSSFSYFISFQRNGNKFNLRYKNDLGNNLTVSTDEIFDFGVWNKYAVSVEVGVGFKIALNGVLKYFSEPSIVAMITDRISTNAYDNTNMGGRIKNIITYPTDLTDQELIDLTTL